MAHTDDKCKRKGVASFPISLRREARIAIFASGNGTNAENIAKYFATKPIKVSLIVADNPSAGVLERANKLGIETLIATRRDIAEGNSLVNELSKRGITLVVLAGFLGKVGTPLLTAFPKRVLNIHPALLPKYGGKGMYGEHVHEAVIAHNECISGITIHIVDEQYDHGETLCQVCCQVFPNNDSPETLAERIHRLEYIYYPVVIEDYIERTH